MEEESENISKNVDTINEISSGVASLLNNIGNKTHGVVKSEGLNGFTEKVQTLKNEDMLSQASKFENISKSLLMISIGIGICDSAYVSSKKTDDPNAGPKRFARNMITIGATYLGGRIGGEFGGEVGGGLGASIGTAISPGGGTAVGGAVGSAIGTTAGSIAGAALASELCNYVFGDLLKW